jgi:methionine-rich copper-binding protein CopC
MARFLPRQLSRLLVLILLTLAAGVGLAGPAAAHNVLTSSDPTDGSTLQTAPTTVRLTSDQPVQDFEPVVTVIGPDGNRYESGAPVVDSTVVTAGVNALPVAGAYSIAYRVVSADGHPVEGEIKFQLADGTASGADGSATAAEPAGSGSAGSGSAGSGSAGSGSAGSGSAGSGSAGSSAGQPSSASSASGAGSVAETATSTTVAAVAPVASSSGLSGWVWAAIAAAGILVAAAIVVIVRRPAQR